MKDFPAYLVMSCFAKSRKQSSKIIFSIAIFLCSTITFSAVNKKTNIVIATLMVLDQQIPAASFYNAFPITKHNTINVNHKISSLYYKNDYSAYSFTYSVHKYLQEIEKYTEQKISTIQREHLIRYINSRVINKIKKKEKTRNKSHYVRIKYDLIKEWEENNNLIWPKYEMKVISLKTGEVQRKVGDYYDAHHIIELSVGGPNVWWNLHPARFPDQHQQGIHRANGACDQLFERELEKYLEHNRVILPLNSSQFLDHY